MNRRHRSSLPRKQQGFLLIALLALLAMGGLYFFISNLTPEAIAARRQAKTEAALVEARDALIGYAIQYRDEEPGRMYGYLPLPDLGSSRNNNTNPNCKDASNNPLEGCDANTPTDIVCDANKIYPTMVGRLPWRTLGTGPLRDGHGECLWLIVSSLHLRKHCSSPVLPPMNWDTLGQLDIVTANGTSALTSALAVHDRPVAIIFSPGSPLGTQNRGPIGTDVVPECGGNYNAANYLDPATAAALGGINNYLAGANNASGITGDSDPSNDPDDALKKKMLVQGKVFKSGANYLPSGCTGTDCDLVANDIGLPITSDTLFAAIRKNTTFRREITSMLNAMGVCLEPTVGFTPVAINGTADANRGKVPDAAKCSAVEQNAPGYFDHYRDQVFAAVAPNINTCKTDSGTPGNCLDVTTQDAPPKKCHAVLILGGQRGPGQIRVSDTDRKTPGNYLEGDNLTSFTLGNSVFKGSEKFAAISSAFPAHTDVVRCIPEAGYSATNPTGDSFLGVQNTALTPYGGQLTGFDAATGTLTLGREFASGLPTGVQTDAYGCAWQPDTHAFSGGLRSYFKFRINDSLNPLATIPLDGFTFAVVDGDYNGINACGAARQHLGYSGNNLDTPYIKPPKIGIEIDLRRNFPTIGYFPVTGFNPSGANTLTNGRSDPSYTGGHVGIVYWGGTTAIATTIAPASCTAPRVLVGGICYLPAEEDDNVHGYPASVSGCRPDPANPTAPATPTLSSGVYKLDPNVSSVPTNQDFHVRVEITRSSSTPITIPTLPAVRIATTGNIDLALPGAIIDGVTLVNGDRLLVRAQTVPKDNGVYVWRGANARPARAADFSSAKALAGAIVTVAEGTQNGFTTWRQSALDPVPDSNDQFWAELRVRVASQSYLDLNLPGTAIDNVVLTSGDRVLVRAQTTATDNGIYVWSGAATPLVRATDADTLTKRSGMTVQISVGTDARAWWRSDGTNWSRLSVRVATQNNIDLNNPGSAIDGCTSMVVGDRVLVRAQADSTRNGIYLWQGASGPMTRATDADAANELAATITQVQEGTDVNRAFRQIAFGATETVDVRPVLWSALDPLAAPQFVIEAWILPESMTDANRIAAMKNTSRPIRTQDTSFTPHLRDVPTIYRPFRRARLGFTIGQSASRNDQTVAVNNLFTTWLE